MTKARERTEDAIAYRIDCAVGEQIKIGRLERGLSILELAFRIGVSEEELHRFESGTTRADALTLRKIATELHTDLSYFFTTLTYG